MYEVCMSADRRVDPNLSAQSFDWENEPPVSLGPEHLYYEEDTSNGVGGLLLKSGLVIMLAISVFGGYQFLKDSSTEQQLASSPKNEWPGGVLSTKENLKRKVRQIDLTKTATVKKTITRPVNTTVIKPVKKQTDRIGDIAKAEPAAPTGNEQFHVVQPGDTVSAISRKFKIKTAEIMSWNGIENPRLLKPGMKLIVSR